MKFSESWLRCLVDTPLSGEALSHLLTMAGLEVEERIPVAPLFDGVVVAQVLSKEKHPDADRLNVLKVDVGQAMPLDIVCGAQNVTVGMKAPCALVGAKLPGIEIKQAKVRGVPSFGMMCSSKELGLAEESTGLLELPADAPVGQDIRQYLDLDDNAITLKLTPNRCDCLSLSGIAREVAALTGGQLRRVPAATFEVASDERVRVKVADSAACPRYVGRVISGVNARATTPDWMLQRLERSGLRGLSALVDITNYVLLELGQPLHAFDRNKIQGEVAVRFARNGEQIKLLNDQTITLASDMLVIADDATAIALAGMMGGADSAVSDETTAVFLESAFFSPTVIAGKSRRLGFGSESSYRFERGVDFSATQTALDRATQLILDICGGQAGAVTAVTGQLPARPAVALRLDRVRRVLGIALEAHEIIQILQRLEMTVSRVENTLQVVPPAYRFDIAIEEDLIEEIARVHGYEAIPSPAPIAALTMMPRAEVLRPSAGLRQMMVSRDYQEVINYAFVEAELESKLSGNAKPVRLKNPIAAQMSVMRSRLLGGLIATLKSNMARKQSRVRVFEIGACFSADEQNEHLAALCCGDAHSEQWGEGGRSVDFYDVKRDLEVLFRPGELTFIAAPDPALHPGKSAIVYRDGKAIGWIGELHPRWLQEFDIQQSVVWFEIALSEALKIPLPDVRELSKFPPVRRDLAVVVDEKRSVQELIDVMRMANVPHVIEVELFDVYRGKGIAAAEKSLAFRVLLQDTRKTLTENEIETAMSCLLRELQQAGAQLRGE